MTTGNFQDWTGTVSDIGPLYPFVGSEVWLWIIGIALWVGWHIWNVSAEKRELEEIERLKGKGPPLEEHME